MSCAIKGSHSISEGGKTEEVSGPCKILLGALSITALAITILGGLTLVGHLCPASPLAVLAVVISLEIAISKLSLGSLAIFALAMGYTFSHCSKQPKNSL